MTARLHHTHSHTKHLHHAAPKHAEPGPLPELRHRPRRRTPRPLDELRPGPEAEPEAPSLPQRVRRDHRWSRDRIKLLPVPKHRVHDDPPRPRPCFVALCASPASSPNATAMLPRTPSSTTPETTEAIALPDPIVLADFHPRRPRMLHRHPPLLPVPRNRVEPRRRLVSVTFCSILGCRGHHLAEHLFIPVGRHAPARAPSLRTAAAALPRYAPPTTSLMDRNIFLASTVVIFYDRPSSRVTLCAGKKPAPCRVFREPWPSSMQQPPPLWQSISFPLL